MQHTPRYSGVGAAIGNGAGNCPNGPGPLVSGRPSLSTSARRTASQSRRGEGIGGFPPSLRGDGRFDLYPWSRTVSAWNPPGTGRPVSYRFVSGGSRGRRGGRSRTGRAPLTVTNGSARSPSVSSSFGFVRHSPSHALPLRCVMTRLKKGKCL